MVARHLKETLDALPQQLAILDEAGMIVFVNRAWEEFGLENGAPSQTGSSALGQSYFCKIDPEASSEDLKSARAAYKGIREVLSGQRDHFRLEYPCHSPEKKRWYLLEVSPREEGGVIVTHSNITKQVKQRLILQQQAYYDQLTGLANRLHFYTQAEHLCKAAKRYGRRFAVLFIDLDGFKGVNDSLGHDAGDYLLVKLAKRLEHQARESDIVARWGGDEFVILLELTEDAEIEPIIRRLVAVIENPVTISRQEVRVSASIGYVLYPNDGQDLKNLVRRADKYMYKTKVHRKQKRSSRKLPTQIEKKYKGMGAEGD